MKETFFGNQVHKRGVTVEFINIKLSRIINISHLYEKENNNCVPEMKQVNKIRFCFLNFGVLFRI